MSRQRAPAWRRGRYLVPFFFAVLAFASPDRDAEDWAASPEAYFLTREERSEWKALESRDSRQRFVERYWLKRDPTPGTAKNEFQELIHSRIKTADARFKIDKTPGSRTARGLVFIVLGTPARFQDELAPRPVADAPRRFGVGVTPVALVEGNETTSTWSYDPDRTPRILEVIKRSSLQIRIVVEPSRHLDAIQDPGLFNDIKETVARTSIVNPDLVAPPAEGETRAAAPPALPVQTLTAAVRQILEDARPTPRSDGGFIGSAVVFRETGDAESLIWVFTPRPSRKSFFHALVRSQDGREITAVTEPAEVSTAFSTRQPGMIAMRRFSLAPGSYSAAVALTDEAGKPLASAALPLQVPALDKDLAVSSLIITRGPASAGASTIPSFTFAGTALPPRADAAFAVSESLWYFIEVANPADTARVMLEPRLRRGGEALAALPPFPANLQPLGPRRYMAGVELPLASLSPGDYVLYLTVTDGGSSGDSRAVRRADFQILP